AAQRQAQLDRRVDARAVRPRQRARQPQAHRADVRVGLGAELHGASAEHLAAGVQLEVALEADYGFVGHANSVSWARARAARSPRTSIARAARSRCASESSGPSTWT